MFKRFIILSTLLICVSSFVFGQEDPVLFTVEGKPVHVSEFNYIYSKTNGDKADYSRASLEEYLELYKNFKLKVQRAKEMKLDTIAALQTELAGYRRQLANSYLVDKEVTERLIREAYDRTLKDVNISHIMIQLSPTASDKEVNIAQQKLILIQKKLHGGQDFESLAKAHSEDNNTKQNGGLMGYFTALFPDGFYQMETAAYTTQIGQVSDIIRTSAGLHLVKVNERRKARGQVEVAHILVRAKKGDKDVVAKAKIEELYQQLKNGADFAELAKAQSEDKKTAEKGGHIGFIGIRQVAKEFEEAVFTMPKGVDFTEPVKTSVGWHIIKRLSKIPFEEYEIAKRRIQTRMQENKRKTKNPKLNRLSNAERSMLERIKRENSFKENLATRHTFINSLDSTFITYKWKAPKEDIPQDVLFTLGTDYKAILGDFLNFCQRNSKRMRMGDKMEKEDLVEMIYEEFVKDNLMAFEESQLEVKYPEFKSLMREYEEGILLFEATKILVWDRASKDSVGLAEFHSTRKAEYKWDERVSTSLYTLKAGNEAVLNKIRKKAKRKGVNKVLKKFNKKETILTAEEKLFEKEKSRFPEGLEWKKGALSEVTEHKRNKSFSFYKVEKILAPTEKTLKEARGYVIADYQDYLDKKWLEELNKSYKVEVNKTSFEGLVKK